MGGRKTGEQRAMRRKADAEELVVLRRRLEAAETALHALRTRGADAAHTARPHQPGDMPDGSDTPYRLLVDTMGEGAITLTTDGRVRYGNPRFLELLKVAPEQAIGARIQNFIAPGDRTNFEALLRQAATKVRRARIRLLRSDGLAIPVHVALSSLAISGAQAILAIIVDLTDLRPSEARRDLLARIVEGTHDGIIGKDINGLVTFWNIGAEDVYGYSAEEIIGKHVSMLAPQERKQEFTQLIARILRGERVDDFDTVHVDKQGQRTDIALSLSPITNDAGEITGISTLVHDIGARKRAEEQVMHMAHHDYLTGLANRTEFVASLGKAIAGVGRSESEFAVLYLDLDHFKDINDTLGHPVGDVLLQAVATRLLDVVRETDTVARFGGDEFAIIQTQVHDPADTTVLAQKVLNALAMPFSIGGNELRTGASIGIAVHGPEAPDAELLLSHADVALYRAKTDGRGTYRFFSTVMDRDVRARVTLVSELREAIAGEEFFLAYQPQVDISTDRIVGVEALVRWRHPRRGLVRPDEFIPVAEFSGLIVPIGRWVLQAACRQMKLWVDAGIAPPLVAVNLSALQFKVARELERYIETVLAETGLPAHYLELELTENVLMGASQAHNDVLLRFRAAGMRIALDDFGTGYSSLDYLRRFPVDRIKIAQGFMADLQAEAGVAAIVKASVNLARGLGIDLVVEGVETAVQLDQIRSWGARKVQGYYYARPMTARTVERHLRKGTLAPAASRRANARPGGEAEGKKRLKSRSPDRAPSGGRE